MYSYCELCQCKRQWNSDITLQESNVLSQPFFFANTLHHTELVNEYGRL